MVNPKLGISKKGKKMHYSVGALIERNKKYLLIDRVNPPYGFAGIAGHVDEGETKEQALLHEVPEESGLKIDNFKLLLEEEVENNTCKRGINVHYWYLFSCETSGKVKQNPESKSIGWYSVDEIKKLKLEPVWEHWFKKLKII
jgi:8-oxo-dGTP diphosphatase